VTRTESFPEGLTVFDFFIGEPGFVCGVLPGRAGVRRTDLTIWDLLDNYELNIYADDDMTRPWTKLFPKDTVLVVREREL